MRCGAFHRVEGTLCLVRHGQAALSGSKTKDPVLAGGCVFAEDARQLTCNGTMIEPSAMSQSPETVILTLGPAQKLTLDLGQGAVNARKVSDNKIQMKFRTEDFEGEYFHYTGDLFLIYKSGHLMKLMCLKRES